MEATLLANGDPTQSRIQLAFLRDMGQEEILQTDTGQEAWAWVYEKTIALILSSWQLKEGMSGLDLLKLVRADSRHFGIPFVIVADSLSKQQVLQAGREGVTEVLVRPFTRETFFRKVEGAMRVEAAAQKTDAKQLMSAGQALMKQGEYDQALHQFERVLQVYENAEVYYNLGYIRTAQGRFEEAVMAFRKATLVDKSFADAYKMMGEVYEKLGAMSESRECLQKAAEIYLEKNKDEKAEETFLKILEINPDTPNVFNSLGIVYRRQKRYEDSIKIYQRAVKVNPQDERILYNMARSYLGLRDTAAACEVLRKAIELDPDFVEAENLLNSILSGQAALEQTTVMGQTMY